MILYLLLTLAVIFILYIKNIYNYWQLRGFLQTKTSFPFGSFAGFGTKFTLCEGFQKYYQEFKGKTPTVGIYLLFKPCILALDVELTKNIFVKDFATFQNRGFYTNKEADPTSVHVLSLEGQEWKERRSKLTPIFTSGKMKMMFGIIDKVSDRLVDAITRELKNTSSLDMQIWAQKYTADNIGNVAFGLECNCLEDPNSEFLKYGRRVFSLTPFENLQMFFTLSFPKLSRLLKLRVNPREPADFFLNTFFETLDYREKSKITRTDFVSLLLGLKDSLTPTEMAAEAFLVFMAGYETSSTLIYFTLYEIAMNSDIQDRLREEIVTGIEKNDGKLTYDLLFEFKYLDMVVYESLRKYPPIPINSRETSTDYKIPETDLIIPKGILIELPIYALHHDPEFFPEPEKFDPERFSDDNAENVRPFTFLPFGEGPRFCLGMRFGLMQSKMAIVKIIQNFEISISATMKTSIDFVPSSPFLSPVGGITLDMKKI